MEKRKKILVCPHWGLGRHALCSDYSSISERRARSRYRGDGCPQLSATISQLRSIEVPSYPITYSKTVGGFEVLRFNSKILSGIKRASLA